MKKRSPYFLQGQHPAADPGSALSWLGKPIWVRGQVRVSVAHAERMHSPERSLWLVKGDHLRHPSPFLLPVIRTA